jgi:hypothetical protein
MMDRYARAQLCIFIVVGGLIVLCGVSIRNGWSQEQVVGSVIGMVVLAFGLDRWRARA